MNGNDATCKETPITYILASLGRILHERLMPSAAPHQVTVDDTHYVVHLNGKVHHVRRDRACNCSRAANSWDRSRSRWTLTPFASSVCA